jgi:DNA-nicking Smr family endonuclease
MYMGHRRKKPPRLHDRQGSLQDDLHVWQEWTKDMTPLVQKTVVTLPKVVAPLPKDVSWQVMEGWHAPVPQGPVSPKRLTKKVIVEARVDLHGLTKKEAFEVVCQSVMKGIAKRCRVLLVITGKGPLSTVCEGGGVLKRSLPEWLEDPLLRPFIASYAPARPCDGGGGAFYVVLKSLEKSSKVAAFNSEAL